MNSCFFRGCAILLVALCSYGLGFADCGPLCACAIDATCADETGCDAGADDCVGTAFTIDCVGGAVVKFDLTLDCADCEHCLACASIVSSSGALVRDLQVGCDENGCDAGPVPLTLLAGSYKIYACLRRCPVQSCTLCSGCTAKARVYRILADCGAPCDW